MTVVINVMGNIQHYWSFSESGGMASYEKNYNLNDALLSFNFNCSSLANCYPGASGWSTGLTGNALLFNKNYSDSISIKSDNYDLFPANDRAFSLSFVFKINSLNNAAGAVNALVSNETFGIDGFRFGIVNGKLKFWSDQDGGNLILSSGNNLSTGTWYHAVVSYTANSGALYLNGQRVDSESGVVKSSLNDLTIGVLGGCSSIDGYIEELRLFNYALGVSDVVSIYNNLPLTPITPDKPKHLPKPIRNKGPFGAHTGIISNPPISGRTMINRSYNGWEKPAGLTPASISINLDSASVSSNFKLTRVVSNPTPAGHSNFIPISAASAQSLSVSISGNGMVFGASLPNSDDLIINCGVNPEATLCKSSVDAGATITLTAPTDHNSTFGGWDITGFVQNNTCTDTNSPCSFIVTGPTSVKASFIKN